MYKAYLRQFVDLFVPDKYMFNIDMKYFYNDLKNNNKEKMDKYNKNNIEEIDKVYDEIKRWCQNNNTYYIKVPYHSTFKELD